MPPYRIGLVVPSSNTTMETEIPELLRRRAEIEPEAFTFHSSRVRLQQVTKEELTEMVRGSDRCALELSDAGVDVIAYACLVAIMSQGPGYHEESRAPAGRGGRRERQRGADRRRAPARSCARSMRMGYERIAIVAPYMKPLTKLVVEYIEHAGIEVVDSVALEIQGNSDVGRHDPMLLPGIAARLDLANAQAVVLSACVQMPSLPAIQIAEDELGLPVLSAAVATTYEILDRLGLRPVVPRAGALLSGSLPVGA